MEADWEFEVGDDAPVIEANWEGFIDLRSQLARGYHLSEAVDLPALAATLERLNSEASPVWTSKCDFWPELDHKDFDSDELDAPLGCSVHGMSCYIDLLPKSDGAWSMPPLAEDASRHLCGLLREVQLRCCRVDLVIRRALIAAGRMDLGITAYITACGSSAGEAKAVLEAALAAFAHVLCSESTLQ